MNALCSIEGCSNPSRKRGWCEKHYSRWKVHGDPLTTTRRTSQAAVCSIDGCDSRPLALDLCDKHYRANRRPASPAGASPRLKRQTCLVPECDRLSDGRGMCGMHYQRWRRFGDPNFYPPQMNRSCTVEDCPNSANARGLCSKHYLRWQLYGDPLFTKHKSTKAIADDIRCSVENCERKAHRRGICAMHLGRLRRHGDMNVKSVAVVRFCATCGTPFDPGSSRARKYCSKLCKPSGRIAGSVNKRAWVLRLGREDGWFCGICGGTVDPGLFWPHPRAGSVDHILPVSRNGTDERFNLRLTHVHCNTSRRDRP